MKESFFLNLRNKLFPYPERWKTSDGEIFNSSFEAIAHCREEKKKGIRLTILSFYDKTACK